MTAHAVEARDSDEKRARGRDFTVVIGLEVHVQLETNTKVFCGCSTDAAEDPNTNVCPTCLGLPGALPVLNEAAVEAALKLGKAIDAEVPERTRFHRKNYYYPDLPKNFQITQYDAPICADGELEVRVEGDSREIGIERAHLEEDPGSLQHARGGRQTSIDAAEYTRVDYNRAGVPLMEIVTEPDFRSPTEVRGFLSKLESVLEYLGIFDAGRDGSLRVDANISMVPTEEVHDDGSISTDALEAANRTEVKNISSHKGAEKALAYEVTRQRNALQRGREIEQETRHWDESRGVTVSMRTKEAEADYRYFREADLPPLEVEAWAEAVEIPELPEARRERFREEYGLNREEASKLTSTRAVADFYEDVTSEFDPDLAATWVADELLGELNYRDRGVEDVEDRLPEFRRLIALVDGGELTSKNATTVLRAMLDDGEKPETIIEREGMGKADDDEVTTAVERVIDENPEAVADYESGEEGAINFLMGQVMQVTGGSADPGSVNKILRDRLSPRDWKTLTAKRKESLALIRFLFDGNRFTYKELNQKLNKDVEGDIFGYYTYSIRRELLNELVEDRYLRKRKLSTQPFVVDLEAHQYDESQVVAKHSDELIQMIQRIADRENISFSGVNMSDLEKTCSEINLRVGRMVLSRRAQETEYHLTSPSEDILDNVIDQNPGSIANQSFTISLRNGGPTAEVKL